MAKTQNLMGRDLDIAQSSSLELQLLHILAQQLQEIDRSEGVAFKFTFSEPSPGPGKGVK